MSTFTSIQQTPSAVTMMESLSNNNNANILQQAHLLNSDIGRHSVKCNFSTRLSGRFYQNSSLERNTARKSKLLEMQHRKRRLEHELRLEEQRVKLLEVRLIETERSREDAHELISTIGRGLMAFQSIVRRNQAVGRYEMMKHDDRKRKTVAIFLQSHYRGWNGRLLVQSMREEMHTKLRNQSAIVIQTTVRRIIQRRQYIDLLSWNQRISHQSASAIQSILRGKLTRRMYMQQIQRRQSAANDIQRVFRGKLGREEYHRLRQLWLEKQKKPKRVPLHMRRYSTYGNNRSAGGKMNKKFVMTRRRSSVEDMSQSLRIKIGNHHGQDDENDSIATTLTSLTQNTNYSQRKRIARGKVMSDGTTNNIRTNKPSWPSTHRVLGSVSRQNIKAHETKTKPLASGSSVASDATASKHSKPRPTRNTQRSKHHTGETRKSLHSGGSKELNSRVPTFISGNLTKDHPPNKKQREDEDGVPTYVSADPAHDCDESGDQEAELTIDPHEITALYSEMESSSPPPPREKLSTPLIISREASLLVEEVLGKTIITHSIVSSTFDDDFSEHEDDLE
eukprot:scaffold16470_cov61-Cyclotella_meneghiniana.AAC.8